MLQGNPYETERWVQERTATVQFEMEQLRLPWATQVRKKVQARRLPSTDQIRWRVRAWWLPVAFGLGTLLGLAVGG